MASDKMPNLKKLYLLENNIEDKEAIALRTALKKAIAERKLAQDFILHI